MLTLDGLRSLIPQKKYLGVVGYPIRHSLSPVFQNAALREMANHNPVFDKWEYLKIEAPVENLKQVIDEAVKKRFKGLNLTLPHKVEVLPFLDHIDPFASKIGAVNTLLFNDDGISGFNTDGFGFRTAVEETLSVSLKDRSVVVIGAGGASRAGCVQCLEDGCKELWIGNRSMDRLQDLLNRLETAYPNRMIKGFELGTEIPETAENVLLVNATSLGLKSEDSCPVPENLWDGVEFVYDMVYSNHISQLNHEASKRGIPFADGLTMLVYQGARSLGIWTGEEIPVEVMKQAVLSRA